MDPDEVTRLVNKLKLSPETDAAEVDVTDTLSLAKSGKLQHYLVGKIFSIRVVNREALRTNLPRILQLRRDVEIEIVGDNIFVVTFKSTDDKLHVLKDGPWHYFDSLMVFKETTGWQNPSYLAFEEFTIWIQLHNLPIACMNQKAVAKIAEQVGVVEEIDIGEGGSCIGQFARVRITRPISKPLQRCVRISQQQAEEQWIVLILYEKLPEFCFQCGRVGHVMRHCQEDQTDGKSQAYGPWLRAKRVADTRRKKETEQVETMKQKESPKKLFASKPEMSKQLQYLGDHGVSENNSAAGRGDKAMNMVIEEAGQVTQDNEKTLQLNEAIETETSADSIASRSPKLNTWKRRARSAQKNLNTTEPTDKSGSGQKRPIEKPEDAISDAPLNEENETYMEWSQKEIGIGRASKKKKREGGDAHNETTLSDLSAAAAVQPRREP